MNFPQCFDKCPKILAVLQRDIYTTKLFKAYLQLLFTINPSLFLYQQAQQLIEQQSVILDSLTQRLHTQLKEYTETALLQPECVQKVRLPSLSNAVQVTLQKLVLGLLGNNSRKILFDRSVQITLPLNYVELPAQSILQFVFCEERFRQIAHIVIQPSNVFLILSCLCCYSLQNSKQPQYIEQCRVELLKLASEQLQVLYFRQSENVENGPLKQIGQTVALADQYTDSVENRLFKLLLRIQLSDFTSSDALVNELNVRAGLCKNQLQSACPDECRQLYTQIRKFLCSDFISIQTRVVAFKQIQYTSSRIAVLMALHCPECLDVSFHMTPEDEICSQADAISYLNSESHDGNCHSPIVLTQIIKFIQTPSQENKWSLQFSLGYPCHSNVNQCTNVEEVVNNCDKLLDQLCISIDLPQSSKEAIISIEQSALEQSHTSLVQKQHNNSQPVVFNQSLSKDILQQRLKQNMRELRRQRVRDRTYMSENTPAQLQLSHGPKNHNHNTLASSLINEIRSQVNHNEQNSVMLSGVMDDCGFSPHKDMCVLNPQSKMFNSSIHDLEQRRRFMQSSLQQSYTKSQNTIASSTGNGYEEGNRRRRFGQPQAQDGK